MRCRHGDPSCDSGLTLGACTFQVALCFNDAGASIYEQQCATTPIISVLDAVVDGCSAATSCRLPLQNRMRVRDAILALGASSGPKGRASSPSTPTPLKPTPTTTITCRTTIQAIR